MDDDDGGSGDGGGQWPSAKPLYCSCLGGSSRELGGGKLAAVLPACVFSGSEFPKRVAAEVRRDDGVGAGTAAASEPPEYDSFALSPIET